MKLQPKDPFQGPRIPNPPYHATLQSMVPAAAAAAAAAGPTEEQLAQRRELDAANSAAKAALAAELEVAHVQLGAADARAAQLEAQVAIFAEEQATIAQDATALIMQSKQKEAANNQLWEEVHQAAQVLQALHSLFLQLIMVNWLCMPLHDVSRNLSYESLASIEFRFRPGLFKTYHRQTQ